MQQSLGEYLRQLRRQKHMTQTELGGEQYSKSYVSALERGNILPSPAAIQVFAERLNQPVEVFEQLLQQAQEEKQLQVAATADRAPSSPFPDNDANEVATLLNHVLTGTTPYTLSLAHVFTSLSHGAAQAEAHSLTRQAHYAFLKGLQAQEQGNFSLSLSHLEYALALAPTIYQPVILDALGMNYYLERQYQTALHYHLRALHWLSENSAHEMNSDLLFMLELHCGDDYRALANYRQACEHYESARQQLRATHNMKMAAQLYLGLGYCTHAAFSQERTLKGVAQKQERAEAHNRTLQRAVSFLMQCRALYQVSHDLIGEATARLLQAAVLLDWSYWQRKQLVRQKVEADEEPPLHGTVELPRRLNSAMQLDDAEEQCRQTLLGWQEAYSATSDSPVGLETIVYPALAYLTRIHGQRATFARLYGYDDTALRERSLAASLCRQALDACLRPDVPIALIHEVTSSSGIQGIRSLPALPSLSDGPSETHAASADPLSLCELYIAAGEIAEELGRAATTADYTHDCYERADQFFRAALLMASQAQRSSAHDPNYLVRECLHYLDLLEERMLFAPEEIQEGCPRLLSLFKDLLQQWPFSVLPPDPAKEKPFQYSRHKL